MDNVKEAKDLYMETLTEKEKKSLKKIALQRKSQLVNFMNSNSREKLF